MKKVTAAILALVLAVTLAGCGGPSKPLSVSEMLDLGQKYLLEMDYEQAIVEFTKVIEIEPKNVSAYIGAAQAYIGLGDTDAAGSILQQGLEQLPGDAKITAMLDGLAKPLETATPVPATTPAATATAEPTHAPAPANTPTPAATATAAVTPEPSPEPTVKPVPTAASIDDARFEGLYKDVMRDYAEKGAIDDSVRISVEKGTAEYALLDLDKNGVAELMLKGSTNYGPSVQIWTLDGGEPLLLRAFIYRDGFMGIDALGNIYGSGSSGRGGGMSCERIDKTGKGVETVYRISYEYAEQGLFRTDSRTGKRELVASPNQDYDGDLLSPLIEIRFKAVSFPNDEQPSAIFKPYLDAYAVVKNGGAPSELISKGIMQLYQHFLQTSDRFSDLCYAFYDINGNGSPELIIGTGSSTTVYDVYTADGGSVSLLIWGGWEDGLEINTHSMTMTGGFGDFAEYSISKDGKLTVEYEWVPDKINPTVTSWEKGTPLGDTPAKLNWEKF